MGLDMYLRANRTMWDVKEEQQEDFIKLFPDIPQGVTIDSIKIEVGYWRKSNQIHRWFVTNVQQEVDDCGYYIVDRHDLTELKNLCTRVLEDHALASELLPTTSGFFFGNTEYEKWYYDELAHTVDILDKALGLSPHWEFEYHSSW